MKIRVTLAGLLMALSTFALAQVWPAQTIKIVVPFTPGTGMDTIARTVAPKLSERLGQPVGARERGQHGAHEDRSADHEGGEDRVQYRLGRGASRVVRFLAQRTRGIKAVHHVSGRQRCDEECAEIAAGCVRAEAVGREEHLRSPLRVHQQHCADQAGSGEFNHDARAVDHRHQPYAERVDQRGEHRSANPPVQGGHGSRLDAADHA